MKLFFKKKSLQFLFKFLATIFSKIGANHTYNKLFKYLMSYKIISLIWKPMKFVFTNIIYFIQLGGAIIAILSLFNISLIYLNFEMF